MNVRKLKTDIWTRLDNVCASAISNKVNGKGKGNKETLPIGDEENQPPKANFNNLLTTGADSDDMNYRGNAEKFHLEPTEEGAVSFQDLISDISVKQKQKEVTLPFYFICLLHLANEKVTYIFYLKYDYIHFLIMLLYIRLLKLKASRI